MTEEELKLVVQELRGKRARCSQYCNGWNDHNKNCDIYGEHHTPPSRCPVYLKAKRVQPYKEKKNGKISLC